MLMMFLFKVVTTFCNFQARFPTILKLHEIVTPMSPQKSQKYDSCKSLVIGCLNKTRNDIVGHVQHFQRIGLWLDLQILSEQKWNSSF